MKNRYLSFLALIVLSSCYDDLSKLPTIEYPSIVVNKAGESSYLLAEVGDEFTYTPRLGKLVNKDTVELSESELDGYNYRWNMTRLAGSDTTSRIISNERVLKTTINVEPSSSRYTLMLQMTEKNSGLVALFSWEIQILSKYSLGLVVAETSDEQNTDLSLIMSRTYNQTLLTYDDDIVHRNIFTKANDEPIAGIVGSLSAVNQSNVYNDITAIVPGKSMVRMNQISMKILDQNQECFFFAPRVFNPQFSFEMTGGKVAVINNESVQYFESRKGTKFSVDKEIPYNLDNVYVGSTGYVDALFFDKKAEKIVQFSCNSGAVSDLGTVETGAFDPNNMQGVKCIFADVMNDNFARWLVKKNDGYYVYEMDKVKFKGTNVYDMADCNQIGESPCYAFSMTTKVLYYAIGNVLYSVPLGDGKPKAIISYDQFPTNEKITHLLIHKGTSGQTTWSEKYDPALGKDVPNWTRSRYTILTAVTYDGKESRVYTLPIQYPEAGGIAPKKYVRCYDKFGRITAITLKK